MGRITKKKTLSKGLYDFQWNKRKKTRKKNDSFDYFYNLKWKPHFGAISADHPLNKSTSSPNVAIFYVYSVQLNSGIENTASVAVIK